jgi:DNA processing protein
MVSDPAGHAGRQAWLHLVLTPGLGPLTAQRLLAALGPPERILSSGRTALAALVGPALASALLRPDPRRDAAIAASLRWANQPGCRLLALDDPDYPGALLNTPDPPALLWMRGNPEIFSRPALAIVGSRAASADGRRNGEAFARAAGHAGLAVISGLAAGIDTAAHRGALDTSGGTIAVLATGIDRIYPPGQRALAEAIAERGALIAEQPPGCGPSRGAFPRRNRLIAGLARGVLVVEAALRSGSLITARLGADLGREVYALPGSIHAPLARGCHHLIREGALLVESPDEILADRAFANRGREAGRAPATDRAGAGSTAAAAEAAEGGASTGALLAALGWDPIDSDTLLSRLVVAGAPEGADAAGALLASLGALEVAGRIERLPDGRFRRLAPT